MTTNRMGLEQTLSDDRLELFISQPLDNGLTRGEQMELVREALACRKASKEAGKVRRFYLDMSDCDSCGQDCSADMVEDLDGEYVLWEEVIPYLYQHAEYTAPPLQAVTVPDGWQLVLIEPTYEMSKAIGLPWEQPPFPLRWKRMLEACPSPKSVTNEP
ncbi:hypothetical protein [Buttiauxella brennerae]|uniref:hypothetical protein n=1 Tax=Buttiauxella brennerae TaxID=82988 RepID=UPI00286F2296|nr:hypothetical protein [Buttiauxella brennerae]